MCLHFNQPFRALSKECNCVTTTNYDSTHTHLCRFSLAALHRWADFPVLQTKYVYSSSAGAYMKYNHGFAACIYFTDLNANLVLLIYLVSSQKHSIHVLLCFWTSFNSVKVIIMQIGHDWLASFHTSRHKQERYCNVPRFMN